MYAMDNKDYYWYILSFFCAIPINQDILFTRIANIKAKRLLISLTWKSSFYLLSETYTSKTQQPLTLSITCLRTITFSKQTLRSLCLSLLNWVFFCVSAKHRILYIFPSYFIPWMIPGDENSHIHSISSSLLLFWDVDIEYRSWKIIKASNRCSKKTCQGKGRNDSLSKFFFFIYMQTSNLNISKQQQVCMF